MILLSPRAKTGSMLSRSLSWTIFWSSEGGGEIKPICTGRSLGEVVPTRGVLGTEDIGVVGDRGRSPDTLFERNMPSKLVPARPKDESSGSGGVSAPPRSGIEPNEVVSMVALDGERGRFAPNNPRNAETATDGGRGGGDAERREGTAEDVPAAEAG